MYRFSALISKLYIHILFIFCKKLSGILHLFHFDILDNPSYPEAKSDKLKDNDERDDDLEWGEEETDSQLGDLNNASNDQSPFAAVLVSFTLEG